MEDFGKVLALLVSPEGKPRAACCFDQRSFGSSSSIEAERSLDDLGFPPAAVRISEATSEPPVETIGNAGAESGSLREPEAPVLGATGGTAPSSIGVNTIPLQEMPGALRDKGPARQRVDPGNLRVVCLFMWEPAKPRLKRLIQRHEIDCPEIDRKGVERVMQARDAGRQPRLMPHNHPGVDIEVSNEEGAVERVIEVNPTAGAWRERGVAMSREQFNYAEDAGITYWLYVVEKALDAAFFDP